MKRLALFGGVLLLAACGSDVADEQEDDDFFSSGEGVFGGSDDGEDEFVPSADAPAIIAADVYCDYTEC